jgi:phosphopantothenoylcysteine decarboxylase/phosphopantothenate--cysteine ligase
MKTTRWLIGITGGIAAYKTPELIRLLKKQGADLRVVLSRGAKSFVTPLTLQAVAGHPVYSELMDSDFEAAMGHIELARWAEGILIAPLSANRLAALALGFADDLLTTLCLASTAPIWVAPAMNQKMWEHPATEQHIQTLKNRGVHILGPDIGEQACGEFGPGRMLEPEAIVSALQLHTQPVTQHLDGLKILISAGPTREAIDPVRFLSNRSSGKMGFALAMAAQKLGAQVTLVTGPVELNTPAHVKRINVTSAHEMYTAIMAQVKNADIFIGAAAVADFAVENYSAQKIKKSAHPESLQLHLVANPDILGQVAKLSDKPFCVGFAAETEHLESNAKQKLKEKQIDLIALNDVSGNEVGFDVDTNELAVFSQEKTYHIPKDSKYNVALKLLQIISECYDAKHKIKNS